MLLNQYLFMLYGGYDVIEPVLFSVGSLVTREMRKLLKKMDICTARYYSSFIIRAWVTISWA